MDSSQPQAGRQRGLKTLLAAGLSFFFPGAGQVYNGQVIKGVAFVVSAFVLWFFFLGWVISLWASIDAGVVRWRLEREDAETNRSGGSYRTVMLFVFAVCVVAVVIVFVISFHSRQSVEVFDDPPAEVEDFVRIAPDDVEWTGQYGDRSQFTTGDRELREVNSPGDFVCRLWSFFGEPGMEDDVDFLYGFKHQASGVEFTAYSKDELAYGIRQPLPEGVSEENVDQMLRQFEGLLASKEPKDCTLVYSTDHGVIRAGVEAGHAFEEYIELCEHLDLRRRQFQEEELPDFTASVSRTPTGAAWDALILVSESESSERLHRCGVEAVESLREMWRFLLSIVLSDDETEREVRNREYWAGLLNETASVLEIPNELVEQVPAED